MKVKVYVIDFEMPRAVKKWGMRVGVPLFAVLGGGVAFAGLPGGYADGQPLTAEVLTANFNYLQNEIAALNPPGTVIAFAGSTCPTGTVAADGSSLADTGTYANLFSAIGTTYGSVDGMHFNVPNAKGVFLRGAGTQVVGGISYAGTLGTTQADQMQGHIHFVDGPQTGGNQNGGEFTIASLTANLTNANNSRVSSAPISDATNGTPRTGLETRPVNLSVLYCIWY